MASAGKMQPVRITELMGHPKSAGKEPASERKKIEPVRIKQLLESASKSCSRTNDRTNRPTFLIPNKGVRRKLYDRSPSPRAPRASICPKSSSRPSTRALNIPQKNPQNPTQAPRFSLFPSSKPRQSLFPSRTPQLPKTLPKPARKSFLLPPNTIVKQHIEKAVNEQTILSSSLISEEENPKEQEEKISRPTVIISAQSSKKISKENELIPETLNNTFSQDSEVPSDQNDLEKSLENKENIPPTPIKPLSESKSLKIDSLTPEILQEALKRLEKLENDILETKTTQNRILKVVEDIYEFLKNNTQENPSKIDIFDKENVNSTSKSRKRSKNSPIERRRSARLARKQVDEGDDSFLLLEEKLNVKTPGKVTKAVTPGKKTPVHDQFMRRRSKSERALKEYLAMKSSMNYLETPEAGKFRNIQGENTPSGKKSLRRSISRKVFDELQDLYSDDVDVQE